VAAIAFDGGWSEIPSGCTKVTTTFWRDLTGARQAAEAGAPETEMAQRRIDFLSLMYKKSSDPGILRQARTGSDRAIPPTRANRFDPSPRQGPHDRLGDDRIARSRLDRRRDPRSPRDRFATVCDHARPGRRCRCSWSTQGTSSLSRPRRWAVDNVSCKADGISRLAKQTVAQKPTPTAPGAAGRTNSESSRCPVQRLDWNERDGAVPPRS